MSRPRTPLPPELAKDPNYCNCAETLLWDETPPGSGYRVKKPTWHNCDYIRKVEAVVDQNHIGATAEAKDIKDAEQRAIVFQKAFASRMDNSRREIILAMDAPPDVVA